MTIRKLLVAAVALTAGCASFTSMQTASVVPEGKLRGFFAPETVGIVVSNSNGGGNAFAPQLEGGIRYGLGSNWDIGAKAWLLGFEIDGKYQFLDSGSSILSVGPGIGYFGAHGQAVGSDSSSLNIITFYLPLYYGLKVGGSELVISPKAIDQLILGSGTDSSGNSSSTGNILYVGGSIGFAIKLGTSFRLMPEVSVMYPASISGTQTSATGSSSSGSISGGAILIQGGIGLLFGD